MRQLNYYTLFSFRKNIFYNKFYSYSTSKKIWPKKTVSGVQPTGALHIGNYLGAVRGWVDRQNANDNISYFIADLHSITLPQEPAVLHRNILQMTATLLACGIDPSKSLLFLQSLVKQHSEFCWILGCLTTMARLAHLPQYKEKASTVKDIPLGLFVYPVLQAADILIYKATHVPVGEDQIQQLQLAQHLANIFNFKFGETFPICHGIIADDSSCKIKSLRDPLKKMSKSNPELNSRINLIDEPDVILEKIKKAVTDFTSAVTYDPIKRPGVSNIILIHSLMSGKTISEICNESNNIDTGKYKIFVADAVIEHINPIRMKIFDYLQHPEYLISVLKEGSEKASEIAEATIQEVKEKVGLGLFMEVSDVKFVNQKTKLIR